MSLGSDAPVAVDVRLVAATNRDLQAEVAAGRFRQDLYFRLAVLEIAVPPLRERPDDIALLAQHFVMSAEGDGGRELSAELHERLARRSWSGNVRELQNTIERLVVLSPPACFSADVLSEGEPSAEELGDASPASAAAEEGAPGAGSGMASDLGGAREEATPSSPGTCSRRVVALPRAV